MLDKYSFHHFSFLTGSLSLPGFFSFPERNLAMIVVTSSSGPPLNLTLHWAFAWLQLCFITIWNKRGKYAYCTDEDFELTESKSLGPMAEKRWKLERTLMMSVRWYSSHGPCKHGSCKETRTTHLAPKSGIIGWGVRRMLSKKQSVLLVFGQTPFEYSPCLELDTHISVFWLSRP